MIWGFASGRIPTASINMPETLHVGKNIDIKKLAYRIQKFLSTEGFAKTRVTKDPYGHYFDVSGIKSGWWRTLSSSRKAVHVIIDGAPNRDRHPKGYTQPGGPDELKCC